MKCLKTFLKADSSIQVTELKIMDLRGSVEAGVINKRQAIVNDNDKSKHKNIWIKRNQNPGGY